MQSMMGKKSREYDFEGRCTKCHKGLDMFLKSLSPGGLRLNVIPCSKHPEASVILWPQRDDIKK